MALLGDETPRWHSRLEEIDCPVDEIRMPKLDGYCPTQDREWCEVVIDGQPRRVRFHNYADLYKIPGLYEGLFYGKLKCCSPSQVARLLEDVMADFGCEASDLCVLDLGAGNGMVGDELAARGVRQMVGIDIVQEAREAADRDRPGLYEDYLVTDLTNIPEHEEELLRAKKFDCLSCVAALGFGDIPAKAFAKAVDLIETPGWLAFNIKESFLSEHDDSGFARLIRELSRREVIQIQAYRRYRHRISVAGQPLHYVAVIARKLRDMPDDVLADVGEA